MSNVIIESEEKVYDPEEVQRRSEEKFIKESPFYSLKKEKDQNGSVFYTIQNIKHKSQYVMTRQVLEDGKYRILCSCPSFDKSSFIESFKCKHILFLQSQAKQLREEEIKEIIQKEEDKHMEEEKFCDNSNGNGKNNNSNSKTNNNFLKSILDREFQPEQIKYRPGRGGKQLSYIETASVISRLNEAFNHQWSWEIINSNIQDDQVIVNGRLTVSIDGKDINKDAYGGQLIQKGSVIGDEYKAASSDALKKAATLLGIGLHLYREKSSGNGGNGKTYQKKEDVEKLVSRW